MEFKGNHGNWVVTTGQFACKRCFTLCQRHGFWLNSTSGSSSVARFVLAPPTNPNLLSDGQTESGEQQIHPSV